MNYLSASNLTVGIINLIASIGAIFGFLFFDLTLVSIITILIFYIVYSGIGIGMMFHRYWSHKSFEFRSKFLKWFFSFIALLTGRGSILGWVHVHREHHSYSDTDKDPHIQNMSILKIFFPAFSNHGTNVNKFLIRDLLNEIQLKINKYYLLIVLIPVLILMIVDIHIAFLVWFAPVFITNILWNLFIWFGHFDKIGYRSYQTKDTSTNSFFFAIFMLGEGWHNNHHVSPKSWTTKVQWWEFDLIGYFIKLVKI